MCSLRVLSLAVIFAVLSAQGVAAQSLPRDRSPLELAEAVERRAESTDFDALEAFGQAAYMMKGREGLNRLHHVAWIFLNQGEFDRSASWNRRLASRASELNDLRYVRIAHLNELTLRYDTGDSAAADEMRRLSETEVDWFVKVHAIRLWALALMDQDQIGEGLRLLGDAHVLIPPNVHYGNMARAGLWEMTGMGLMKLNDIDGATEAFGHYEIDYANPIYPRPDFDTVYNLTRLSTQLGDVEQAERLYQVHHRLAMRSGLSSLRVYDANLCAMVAQARTDPRAVLECLAPYGETLGAARFLAPHLLPARAVARAMTGQLDAARRDMAQIRARIARDKFREEGATVLPLVEAEILFAEGRHAAAYVKLREYARNDRIANAMRFSAGMRQVTGDMQNELEKRRSQLETERANARLQGDVIMAQAWVVGISVLFALTAGAALFWLWRQASRLRIARSTADAANRAKSEFLANMSHEIRTPLNGVVAMADALSRSGLTPREQEMAEVIRASGTTLERLLSDILDMAKIEAGEVEIERAPFDLGEAVRSVAALYRSGAEEKGVQVLVQLDAAVAGTVAGDVVRLRQVLSNLISNALKFTLAGSVSVKVMPGADGRVRFVVADTGCGFGPEQKERIFARFQQADGSITRRFGGTGLGLAISRDLVRLMGGDLDCEGRPGEGADFWFELDLPAAERVEPVKAREEIPEIRFPARILLADDHPANRKVVEIMLSAMPTELVAVENGAEALRAFSEGGFDLVLMDMQMPVMDGLSATLAIRTLEREAGRGRTPLIMLTANALPEHVEAGRQAGADVHLSKPVTLDGLLDAIGEAMTVGADEGECVPA